MRALLPASNLSQGISSPQDQLKLGTELVVSRKQRPQQVGRLAREIATGLNIGITTGQLSPPTVVRGLERPAEV